MAAAHDFHFVEGRIVSEAWWVDHVGTPFRSGDIGLVLTECRQCGSRATIAGNPLGVVGYGQTEGAEADDWFTPTTMPVVLKDWPEWSERPTMVAASSMVGVL